MVNMGPQLHEGNISSQQRGLGTENIPSPTHADLPSERFPSNGLSDSNPAPRLQEEEGQFASPSSRADDMLHSYRAWDEMPETAADTASSIDLVRPRLESAEGRAHSRRTSNRLADIEDTELEKNGKPNEQMDSVGEKDT